MPPYWMKSYTRLLKKYKTELRGFAPIGMLE
jgi:hypothetical protein